jgi:hypothetical protein
MKFFEQKETSEITSHQSLLPEVLQLMQQHHPQQGEAKAKDLAMHGHNTDPGIQNIPEQIIPLHKGLAQWKTLDQERANLGIP